MQAAGKSNLKRVSLELGGKSPFIIFADANGMIFIVVFIFKVAKAFTETIQCSLYSFVLWVYYLILIMFKMGEVAC